MDNLEAVAWQPQPGRATGCRSFLNRENSPPGSALSAKITTPAQGSARPA
nr:hypothetical protein [Klebsiella pneumoniae subsp. pneumoniae]